MRILYSCLIFLLSPFLLLRLLWKSKRLPAYRQRIAERLMLQNLAKTPVDIWIHAVSLGEVIAASPLIDALLQKQYKVLVTTTTPTGSERVFLGFGDKVRHQYLPFDLSCLQSRFLKTWQPRLGLIMETELWPNLIHQASKTKTPLFLINARLSDRSVRGYRKAEFFFKPLLNQFTAILTQSDDDAMRFKQLGARSEIVHAVGNMKFDLAVNTLDLEPYKALKKLWGAERVTLIATSTHDDEEAQILRQLRIIKEQIPDFMLLIAPRHPERFQSVYDECMRQGLNTGLRSKPDTLSFQNEVVVLDSLGELMAWYSMSDFAFVGGSFVPKGGHNVLEPIAVNVPVFIGPDFSNFKSICRELQAAHAIKIVDRPEALVIELIKLVQDDASRIMQVRNAYEIFSKNKGAVQGTIEQIETLLNFKVL